MNKLNRPHLNAAPKRVLGHLCAHIEQHGIAPSIRELGEATGLLSSSTVHHHLTTLQELGYIQRKRHSPRCIRILRTPDGAQLPESPNVQEQLHAAYRLGLQLGAFYGDDADKLQALHSEGFRPGGTP